MDNSAWQNAICQAASQGHLHVVKYLLNITPQGIITPLEEPLPMDKAAKFGYDDIVVVLHEHPTTSYCTTDAMDDAAAHGNLELVMFLHQNRQEGCTDYGLLYAAMNGQISH
ncbi:hypothetical protein THRCLA_01939 [Thraustotheca clavata]|uniref:Uncharacterized protein n=1 Tax=Thraustotheca clavata TaxID=74557 RepID=A0A1W0A709_9STRA|nr:hypothetical protein THRCLA_01939 [Thraustotheca clavata]